MISSTQKGTIYCQIFSLYAARKKKKKTLPLHLWINAKKLPLILWLDNCVDFFTSLWCLESLISYANPTFPNFYHKWQIKSSNDFQEKPFVFIFEKVPR